MNQYQNKNINQNKVQTKQPEKDLLNKSDLMTITIVLTDRSLNFTTLCKPDTLFEDIEKKLYEIYPEYSKTENTYLYNGSIISSSKSMKDNEIENGAMIKMMNY